MQYIVERSSMARAGKRYYMLGNGVTCDPKKATRMSREYAEATAREFRRAGGEADIWPETDTWGAAVLAVGAL